ncbi:amino acid ABC transporter ATP-binding protein [Rickettsia endosymbiont of Cardiosporidium cionae]|uniref:amino acid ABC transporter ATP-binding protein n=1 Tax=Rickettsia endosymbiont of Cardiosporidium cionae TaxID=2777155 RepID=UPI001892DA0B|nr:amino acid ABC transporter ATP-binding protein [Rickettsia endosymbiont of Cardiosporidium cionae]KAF8818941.1 amino acid ABC transporter ATP-binding protein [Rickettsia endosymbiont of Cardiosporidium cionae]
MIEFRKVFKTFNQNLVLNDINLVLDKKETIVIIGSSGSGKSTLIRCINYLEVPDNGKILIDGEVLYKKNAYKLSNKIGMVFQQFYLFDNMNVVDNLTYAPIQVLKISKKEAVMRSDHLLEQFALKTKKYIIPQNLSGGQKQRVAICRALMMDPKIMLFDEPTSALDSEMIKDIVHIINGLKNKMQIIVVTHHIKFAKIIADRIIFLNNGRILSDQRAEDFFSNPSSDRARVFLSNVKNLI